MPTISADIMERMDRLAEFSESSRHLTRRSYTPALREANDLAACWMCEAGMAVREDSVGNIIGRYEGLTAEAPAIVLGSHLDTVINGGRYDGPLGILSAIDCVRSLRDRGIRYDNAIEVVIFMDEEGVRYQATFLGSDGMAGNFNMGLLERRDKDGIPLTEAMSLYGLDPTRIGDAARRPEDIRCYLEVHIEQGPVLESENLAVGVVSAIAGAVRMTVTVTGTAGHAGTVPMAVRKDALAAAAECVLQVEASGRRYPDAVATVGQIEALPGTTNVIAGDVSFSVDVRAPIDADRRAAVDEITEAFEAIAVRRGVRLSIDKSFDVDGVACAPLIVEQMERAIADHGLRPLRLPSGAGHDAAAMAAITDVGMIFVRCKDGRSHCPEEMITREDAIAGTELLLRTIERIGNSGA